MTKGHRTELQQQRLQVCEKLGTKNSKSNEGRQGKNGGVKADYTRERLSYVRRAE